MAELTRLAALLALAIAAVPITAARADDYPSRPVRLIIGFPPGSSADITARIVGAAMSPVLGQQVVIENKPGAASGIAAEFVARAPKDGYMLFLGSSANLKIGRAHV